jgi:hypothetical protein
VGRNRLVPVVQKGRYDEQLPNKERMNVTVKRTILPESSIITSGLDNRTDIRFISSEGYYLVPSFEKITRG